MRLVRALELCRARPESGQDVRALYINLGAGPWRPGAGPVPPDKQSLLCDGLP